MRTIKETRVDKTLLRLVDTGKSFVGLAIFGDTTRLRIEGATADEVWNGCMPKSARPTRNTLAMRGSEPLPSFLPDRLPLEGL
jgi:hypothetical protein